MPFSLLEHGIEELSPVQRTVDWSKIEHFFNKDGQIVTPLTEAILKDDARGLQVLAEADPRLLTQRSEGGLFPLDLAWRAGKICCVATLVRLGAPAQQGIELREVLEQLMRSISQRHSCAGWLEELEYLLWSALLDDAAIADDTFHFADIDAQTKSDLMFLSEKTGGWIMMFSEFVPLVEWNLLYAQWKCDQKTQD